MLERLSCSFSSVGFFLSQGCPSLILGHFSLCFNNLGGDFHSWMYLPLCFTWNFPKMVTSMSPTPLALLQCDTQSYLEEGCGFSIIMYGCESWTIKKAEHRRIDASELWCWKRLLRGPWTARRSNQSILKEISLNHWKGLILKLKLQYFGHMMQKTDSFEKTLMLGKIEGGRRTG